ncbi:MAG: hypothetical protein CM1200mP10_00510 [Candidatus Neomarinimicrobiota bacterium]|nr:MAG: hypothetical protein CM1200mP10_00510 [Candidatus Neomarinimicrobiota bacterium]
MTHRHVIEIRIACAGKNPKIPSVEAVWRIGDWFERETTICLELNFKVTVTYAVSYCLMIGKDLGPFRKDYEVQETYHGIMVPKVKEGWE